MTAADARRFVAEHQHDGDPEPPLTGEAVALLRALGWPAARAPHRVENRAVDRASAA